jgi:hypothetical protein
MNKKSHAEIMKKIGPAVHFETTPVPGVGKLVNITTPEGKCVRACDRCG